MASLPISKPGHAAGLAGLFSLRTESDDLLRMDLMRFVAAMGVVACHGLEFTVPAADRALLNQRAGGLALFVEFFFIISGFVIAWVYAQRLRSPAGFVRFLQRRIGRLWPLHILTLLAAAALWIAAGMIGVQTNTAPDLSAQCIAKTAFLLHAVIPCDGSPPNGQSWSISAEMLAYVLFPAFLFLLLKGGKAGMLAIATLIAAGLALVLQRDLALVPDPAIASGIESISAIRVIPTFLTGMVCYRYRAILAKLPFPGYGTIAFTLAFLVACALIAPDWVKLLLIYCAAIATIAADMRGKPGPAVTHLAPLGQLTYSIYMLHGLVLMALVNAIGDKWLGLPPLPLTLLLIVALGIILLASLVSYKFVETPARRYIDRLPLVTDANRKA